MSYRRGDVVWGPDPFKSGENPRPWLILNNDAHPFGDEEYMTVTLTTTPHDEGVSIDESDWIRTADTVIITTETADDVGEEARGPRSA